jgi:hypothetical protein
VWQVAGELGRELDVGILDVENKMIGAGLRFLAFGFLHYG